MDLKPLKTYKYTKYPTKKQFAANPLGYSSSLFKRLNMPMKGIVISSAMMLLLSGCVRQTSKNPEEPDGFQTAGIPALPQYFTEQEILNIFTEAAKKEGLNFSLSDGKLVEITLPESIKTSDSGRLEIKLDAYNAEKNIGIEFVDFSDKDFEGCNNPENPFSIVDALNRADEKNEKGTQIYYLPPVEADYSDDFENNPLIKAQVDDFIKWLENQGII